MPPQAPHAENVQPNGAEFNEHPDFLDLVYKMIRFAFLAAIILYSSFDRIIFVVAVVCIMWFVQMRRERENRNGSQNERPGNGNQEQAAVSQRWNVLQVFGSFRLTPNKRMSILKMVETTTTITTKCFPLHNQRVLGASFSTPSYHSSPRLFPSLFQ